ncbi:MAG: hypothetical protein CBC13_01000 [Planctomycetia bacterium TMED53]|nr:MAG: hypothetical protein CBC13_01000 [Planctomycetia bacterium TMED53]
MKLLIRLAPAVLIIVFFIQWFVIGISSPREQIIESVIGMEEGFNGQRAGDVVVHCTEDFRESTYQLNVSSFRGALFRIFMGQRDKKDQSFLWQVSVQRDSIELDPDPDLYEDSTIPETISVTAPVNFYRRGNMGMGPVWVMEVQGDAVRDEDGRWRFRRAKFRTLSGRMPF